MAECEDSLSARCSADWWHSSEATALCQCALSTRAGCECVAHAVQATNDVDGTILSIDGIGAFDLVSRGAMLEGLRFWRVEALHSLS